MAQWGLEHWDDLAAEVWPNLLIGNGLSISVSEVFRYDSLFELAAFDPDELLFFFELGTHNIEIGLLHLQGAVSASKLWCPAVRFIFERRYEAIRQRLIATIRSHHPAHADISGERLRVIGGYLAGHDSVWMTSYDLVAYWAAMAVGDDWFDGFFNGDELAFDTDRVVRLRPEQTYLWWPHGAVHLYRRPDGVTAKHRRSSTAGLLGILRAQADIGPSRPLIVSEGRSREKVEVIARSDYLTHALDRLRASQGNLVVFGQALTKGVDDHLVDAIRQEPGRRIAYGVHAGSQAEADETCGRVRGLFPGSEVVCFASATHPLAG